MLNEHNLKAEFYFEMWKKTGVSFYRAWQAHELLQTGRKRKLKSAEVQNANMGS
jgi:hypothetical protein